MSTKSETDEKIEIKVVEKKSYSQQDIQNMIGKSLEKQTEFLERPPIKPKKTKIKLFAISKEKLRTSGVEFEISSSDFYGSRIEVIASDENFLYIKETSSEEL